MNSFPLFIDIDTLYIYLDPCPPHARLDDEDVEGTVPGATVSTTSEEGTEQVRASLIGLHVQNPVHETCTATESA